MDTAKSLTIALETITAAELAELSEDDTVRLATAFETFVEKIAEVMSKRGPYKNSLN